MCKLSCFTEPFVISTSRDGFFLHKISPILLERRPGQTAPAPLVARSSTGYLHARERNSLFCRFKLSQSSSFCFILSAKGVSLGGEEEAGTLSICGSSEVGWDVCLVPGSPDGVTFISRTVAQWCTCEHEQYGRGVALISPNLDQIHLQLLFPQGEKNSSPPPPLFEIRHTQPFSGSATFLPERHKVPRLGRKLLQ